MSDQSVSVNSSRDLSFFRTCITAMAVVLVSGFVVQLMMGRSSFNSPLIVHLHALVFMSWLAITLSQAWLAVAGGWRLHRFLGVLALFWAFAMAVVGPLATLGAVRTERVPFFFQPQYFLLADPATLLGFLVLFLAALALRRRPDWHMRLQVGAFMMLMGPGLGRLLPMPLLMPFAFDIAALVALVVPLFGIVRDWTKLGRIHPAWVCSIAVLLSALGSAHILAFSAVGNAIYAAATAGSPAAGLDGRLFPVPPQSR